MKIKYWTVCINTNSRKAVITLVGQPFSSKRDAKRAMKLLNSTNAAVVLAGFDGLPTTFIVESI